MRYTKVVDLLSVDSIKDWFSSSGESYQIELLKNESNMLNRH
jgi:hypothetical protein